MKVYDKAKWHIEGKEDTKAVIERFKVVFKFLQEKNLLNAEGTETYELGIDSSISLTSSMLNTKGITFIEKCYDSAIKKDPTPKALEKTLDELYKNIE